MFDELVNEVVKREVRKERRKWEWIIKSRYIEQNECSELIASMKDEEPCYDFLDMCKKIRRLKKENKGLQRKITELQKELGRC